MDIESLSWMMDPQTAASLQEKLQGKREMGNGASQLKPGRCFRSGKMALPPPSRPRYVGRMQVYGSFSALTAVKVALGTAALAALSGVALAAWLDHGTAILMSMAQTGLSWCF